MSILSMSILVWLVCGVITTAYINTKVVFTKSGQEKEQEAIDKFGSMNVVYLFSILLGPVGLIMAITGIIKRIFKLDKK